MFGSLDVSVSALVAQRVRLETIAANVANSNSIYDSDGNYAPYRRRFAVFAPGDPASGKDEGVHVSKIMLDRSPFQAKHMPGHPDADAKGYVYFPNIDPTHWPKDFRRSVSSLGRSTTIFDLIISFVPLVVRP